MVAGSKEKSGTKTFGEALREFRLARGLTLRQLAKLVGVSPPFVSDLEHNRRRTTKIGAFARALRVPESELAQYENRLTADLKEWIAQNPGLVELLRSMKRSGLSVAMLRKRCKLG